MTVIKKLIVAYDGSPCSEAALVDLRHASLPSEVEAIVLTVAESWLPPPPSYGLVDTGLEVGRTAVFREASELARKAAGEVARAFPGWNVRSEVRAGSPARKILELAREWKADLVVVGSHGKTRLDRFMLGSVSQKVATEAPCSVRIARSRVEEIETGTRLVIGLDGSSGAEAAVRAVASRVWPRGSAVRLVTAVGPFSLDGTEVAGALEHMGLVHGTVADRLREAGLCKSSVIREDDPRQLIVREAEQWGADCIFLGAVGELTLDRLLFGTVVAAVASRAPCSVEIVR